MPHGTEVGLGPGDIVLNGDPASPPQKGGRGCRATNLWPMPCGQTAGWIKTVLRIEVGLVQDTLC